MADATVLNTVGLCPCGFESRLRHMADLAEPERHPVKHT